MQAPKDTKITPTASLLVFINTIITSALERLLNESPAADLLQVDTPPQPKMGDFAYGCFKLGKALKVSPNEAAQKLSGLIETDSGLIASVKVCGPYVNLFLNRSKAVEWVLKAVNQSFGVYGASDELHGETVMVEFLSPNTNKPLHLGHLRNGVIGTVVANLLQNAGAIILRANNINDRGIHIIKSMIAYDRCGNGETPESTGEKGDHFVGRFYVKYNQLEQQAQAEWQNNWDAFWLEAGHSAWLQQQGIPDAVSPTKEQQKKMAAYFKFHCPLLREAREMLRLWEQGDVEVRQKWQRMNEWVYAGFDQTNARVGFNFERVYYESETYLLGRDIILAQLEKDIGFRGNDSAVLIDMGDVGLNGGREGEKPVLLIRSDGTSVYITQDVGLAVTRFQQEENLISIIYVVAREQELHFKRLFELLKRYGYGWYEKLFHLSYGMVNLPSGKMKSREGTVVDADNLMNELRELALKTIQQSGSLSVDTDIKRAEAIALAALRFYLASVTPRKDTTFDVEASIQFEGCTGPYLQYACARISAIERKADGLSSSAEAAKEFGEAEFSLAKLLGCYPSMVRQAAERHDPATLTLGLYNIAKAFSVFYTNCPVITGNPPVVNSQRLQLCQATRTVLSHGLGLLGIPVLERM